MAKQRRNLFIPSKWVEFEIEDMADCYGLSKVQAAEDVLQFLREGQYRDELTDKQNTAAIAQAHIAIEKLKAGVP